MCDIASIEASSKATGDVSRVTCGGVRCGERRTWQLAMLGPGTSASLAPFTDTLATQTSVFFAEIDAFCVQFPLQSAFNRMIDSGNVMHANSYWGLCRRGALLLALSTTTAFALGTAGTVKINCGGPAYTDSGGQIWAADKDFVGGSKKNFGSVPVSGTNDSKLYQTERYAKTLTYNVPVPNGTYTVNLHFAEMYFTSAGQRVFDVTLEGQTVLQNFDIFAIAGAKAALQRSFIVSVNNGTLNIVGTARVNNAKLSAIDIVPNSNPTPTPTPTPTPGAGTWTTAPSLPISVGEVSSVVINGMLYVVGGSTNATMAYDMATQTWRSDLPVRPFIGDHHSAEGISNKLYLFGGLNGAEGKVQIYNPTTNKWSSATPMPWAAGSIATSYINGKVYAAGGIVGSTTVSTAAVYDPSSDTWASIPSMPAGRNHTAAGTDGNKMYVFGGRTGGNRVSLGFADTQVYNPATNTWQWSGQSNLAPLPQRRGGMGKAAFYGNEFYVIGGETTDNGTGDVAGNVYNRVDVYNPATNTWRRETNMPTARHGISPFAADNKIWVAGGGIHSAFSNSTVFEVFSR
jgi:N-acetylneuraminic acid mutarotase